MNLLLHMCCGPCSCYPVKKLRQEGIEPVGYFFNPNIHPYKEWDMRLKTAREFAAKVDMKMYDDDNYRLRDFLRRALAAEAVENGRCRMCYTWRLEETARFAAEQGFDAFTSTLFYSIYQQHELMKETAEHFAKLYGVEFYYEDFRPGWQEGIDIRPRNGLDWKQSRWRKIAERRYTDAREEIEKIYAGTGGRIFRDFIGH